MLIKMDGSYVIRMKQLLSIVVLGALPVKWQITIKWMESNNIWNKNIIFASEIWRYGKRKNKVIGHTGQGLSPVDKGTEYTFSQKSGKGFCEGESGDASVLLGTG